MNTEDLSDQCMSKNLWQWSSVGVLTDENLAINEIAHIWLIYSGRLFLWASILIKIAEFQPFVQMQEKKIV